MADNINESNVKKAEEFLNESTKDKEFDLKAFNIFLESFNISLPEVINGLKFIVEKEYSSSDKYMEHLSRHLGFLEELAKDSQDEDKNEIIKQIKYVLDLMREERKEQRSHSLKQMGIVAVVATLGVSALTLFITRDAEKAKKVAVETAKFVSGNIK